MDVEIYLRVREEHINPLGLWDGFYVWQLAVWCTRHCLEPFKETGLYTFLAKKPYGGACRSAILWPSFVENVNIFIMGLHLMAAFPFCCLPPPQMIAGPSRGKQNLDNFVILTL